MDVLDRTSLSRTETGGAFGSECGALDAGEYVDVSGRFPVECRAMGIRARVVFSRDCWEAIVVSSVNAYPSWTENGRLRFVLSRFLDDCPWPKVGQVVSFEVRARAPDGKPEERVVREELRLWDGAQNSPFLWFSSDGEQRT